MHGIAWVSRPVDVVTTKGIHSNYTGEDLNQHVRNFRRVVLVHCVRKYSRNNQVGTLLDELHCCNLGLKLGVACLGRRGRLDLDPGCPATLVRELKQANKVVEPACNLVESNTF